MPCTNTHKHTAPARKTEQNTKAAREDEAAQRGLLRSPDEAKQSRMVFDRCYGARSAAGRMTALSLWPNARGHGFQMHHYPFQATGPTYELAV